MDSASALAREYVGLGWSVLPVRPDEKRPYMTNWLQYNHSRATAQQVDSWFASLSGAGVGAVTGKVSAWWCSTWRPTAPRP